MKGDNLNFLSGEQPVFNNNNYLSKLYAVNTQYKSTRASCRGQEHEVSQWCRDEKQSTYRYPAWVLRQVPNISKSQVSKLKKLEPH